jgi:hypothetical protein
MARSNREGETGPSGNEGSEEGQARDVQDEPLSPLVPVLLPGQSPLFHAEQADRYDRQRLIAEYEALFNCRLIAMVDAIFPYGVTLFEELVYDADSSQDLHLLEEATAKVQESPDTYPIHASLLSDVTGLMVQQARAALGRTDDLLFEALRSNPNRSREEVDRLVDALAEPLINAARSHGAIFGTREAYAAGLPVVEPSPNSLQWQIVWRLWAKYFALSARVYEGQRASKVLPWAASVPEETLSR